MSGRKIVLLIHHLHIVPTSFEHKHNFLYLFFSFKGVTVDVSEGSEPVYMNIRKTTNDRGIHICYISFIYLFT